ncbi:right-handed parallel beta-helix repeat-containing protein [candidate division KSB1 bacterium]|nr:right-handed parallel beta-helix repeat-containing protein [candidate division KSB1 bacterium]
MKTLVTLLCVSAMAAAAVLHVDQDLQSAFDSAGAGDTLVIAPGRYEASPQPYSEETCGNCREHRTRVQATVGFRIADKPLRVQGAPDGSTVLVANAGYGLFLLNARGIVIENLTVTGGARDRDGSATDAAIVIKHSTAKIHRCTLRGNTHYFDSTIVGIGGIMIREGSEAWITQCRIIDNSWDGIALYRGATAMISDCVIDSGRGAGIGVTWDATATCLRNRISHYWKGLGSFGTSTVIARNNLIRDNLGWGLIASGESTMIAEQNTVVQNGNCGIAIWNHGARGRIVNNISAGNGWRKQWVCPCVGFMNQESDTSGAWVVRNNLLWSNAAGNVLGHDASAFLVADPMFADTVDFRLLPDSPALTAGDTLFTNADGTPAALGIWGGPAAR